MTTKRRPPTPPTSYTRAAHRTLWFLQLRTPHGRAAAADFAANITATTAEPTRRRNPAAHRAARLTRKDRTQ